MHTGITMRYNNAMDTESRQHRFLKKFLTILKAFECVIIENFHQEFYSQIVYNT